MTIQDLRERKLIVFECISGSRSYGLDLPESDIDLKGVFVLPKEDYYGLNYVAQVSSEKNDEVFYELKRFFELLERNNPNIIEVLGIPDECVLYKHPLMDMVKTEMFLSRLCQQSFANYALSQIKKARGLNKKINKPIEEERKNVLHFCYVTREGGAQPLLQWLQELNIEESDCGLVAIDHMRDLYALYIDRTGESGYRGIYSGEEANEVHVSSVPKGELPATYLYFNRDGYSVYCKDYKSYWEWVGNRNDVRYENTLQHGKKYDAKNMMHVFRLLDMAKEIAEGKGVITKRPNREHLLKIRSGAFEYDELLQEAEEQIRAIEWLYSRSTLPGVPDSEKINSLLVEMRQRFYMEENQ